MESGFRIAFLEKDKPAAEFKASPKFDKLLEVFAPLQVVRVIKKNAPEKDEEFGIDEAAPRLTVALQGEGQLEFVVGKKSYGSRNLFLADLGKKAILLINGTAIDDFKRANRAMFERRLVGFSGSDVTSALLKAGSISSELTHDQRGARGQIVWQRKDKGEEGADTVDNWMNKLLKLTVTEYAPAERAQQFPANAEPLLELSFRKGAETLDQLEFIRVSADGKSPAIWVRGKFSGGWARVSTSRYQALEKDLSAVFGS